MSEKVVVSEPEPELIVLISEAEKLARIEEMGVEIAADYQGKNVLLVGILKGAVSFMSQLSDALWKAELTDFEWDFMAVTSYGSGTESSRAPRIVNDLETDITGRHVLLVEDIVDSGFSLDKLVRVLLARDPTSLEIATLLSKPSRREVAVEVKYIGFEIENHFVVGAGMDKGQQYRGNPDIVYFPEG